MSAFSHKRSFAAVCLSAAFAASVLFVIPAVASTEIKIINGTLSEQAHIMLDQLVVSLEMSVGKKTKITVGYEQEKGLAKVVIEEGVLAPLEEEMLDALISEIEAAAVDVEVEIEIENDPPVASDQSVSVIVGNSVTITLEATDANNDVLGYEIKDEPAYGELSAIDGALVVYTPDGTSETDRFTFFANDGFEESATSTVSITVVFPAPSVSPAAGTYTSIQSIALTTASTSAPHSIHYTLDGTAPDCASLGTLYTEPISVFSSKTLNAIACYENDIASDVVTFSYVISELKLAPSDLPLLLAKNIFVPTEAATSTPVVVQVVQKVVLSVSGTNGTSTIQLPKDVVISRADGENLDAALLTATDMATSSLSNLGSGTVFEGALQWGMASSSLQFSVPITLSIYVGEALNGQTLDVMRSPDGSSGWTSDGIVPPATCTVANGICTFEATKASVYAASRPPVASPSSGGGGGGTHFFDTTPPGNPAVTIAVAVDAATGTATLVLSAEDAYEMIVADNPEFTGAMWERYAKERPWAFEPENGKTTAYVKFRDVVNNETAAVSATWGEKIAAVAPPEEPAPSTVAPAAALQEVTGGSAGSVPQPQEVSIAPRYEALRYEVEPAPPLPPLLAALDSVFGTSALNFSLVVLSALFGAAFYPAYDFIRARFF